MVTSGEGWGEGTARDLGTDTYTMPCVKWIADKDPLYSTGNSAQCVRQAGWRGEWALAHVRLSCAAAPLKQHCQPAPLQCEAKHKEADKCSRKQKRKAQVKEGVGCERTCTRYWRKVCERVHTYIHVSKHTHTHTHVCTHEYTVTGPKSRVWPEGSRR